MGNKGIIWSFFLSTLSQSLKSAGKHTKDYEMFNSKQKKKSFNVFGENVKINCLKELQVFNNFNYSTISIIETQMRQLPLPTSPTAMKPTFHLYQQQRSFNLTESTAMHFNSCPKWEDNSSHSCIVLTLSA